MSDTPARAIQPEGHGPAVRQDASLAESLAVLTDFWASWGFKRWTRGTLAGVTRKQRVVADPVLGHVGEYAILDYIVWSPGTEREREELWRALKPLPSVAKQRFLFLREKPWPKSRARAFLFGVRGGAEFHAYWPEPWAHPDEPVESSVEPRDLTSLVRLGLRLAAQAEKGGATPPNGRTQPSPKIPR